MRLQDLGVRNFLVAGGETAGAVLKVLDIGRLEVADHDETFGGDRHAPGHGPTAFVLRPGGVGEPHFLFTALERSGAAERQSSKG